MAQSERFYFWRGYYDALRKLPTVEQRHELIMALCAYAFDGVEPTFDGDPTLDIVWSLISEQVHESVEIGREMAKRGRRSGEARKRKAKTNTVPNTVPNEGKGRERNGSVFSSLPIGREDGAAPSADAERRASSDEHARAVEAAYAASGVEAPPVPQPPAGGHD